MQRCAPEALRGGDAAHNAAELTRVMSGEDRGAHRDALVMGTSLVLEVTGSARDPAEGAAQAAAAIDNGHAAAFLNKFHNYFSG